MVFICENCQIFKSSNHKSYTNHKRYCSKNKKQFSAVDEYNHAGILKFHQQASSSFPKISSKSAIINNKFLPLPAESFNKECNVTSLSPNSSNGDYQYQHSGDNPLDDFYDDEQQDHEMVVENKYVIFQRKIISLYSKTRITNFGDYNHNNSSSMENKLKLGHTLPIIPWDRYSQDFDDKIAIHTKSLSSISHSSSILSKLSFRTPACSINLPLYSRPARGIPNTRDILDIFVYYKKHFISVDDGNSLLKIIHQMFGKHPPVETFFTSQYKIHKQLSYKSYLFIIYI